MHAKNSISISWCDKGQVVCHSESTWRDAIHLTQPFYTELSVLLLLNVSVLQAVTRGKIRNITEIETHKILSISLELQNIVFFLD